jgi:hypothetical protein
MGLGSSIFLIAIGAILDFGVTAETRGFNIHTIGLILMVVGAIGVLLSLIFWSSWGGWHSGEGDTVIVNRPVRRRVYEDI